MGTTPNLRLPYPELTDSPDVPRDIKALALALDAPKPPTTGFVQLNWTGNYSPAANTWTNLYTNSVARDNGNGFIKPDARNQHIEVLKACTLDLSAQLVCDASPDWLVALGTDAEKANSYAWAGSGGVVTNARRLARWGVGSQLQAMVNPKTSVPVRYFILTAIVVEPV